MTVTDVQPAEIRRFQMTDLNAHGAWVLPRLLQAYPHLSERSAAGWLQGIVYSNEFLFLSLPFAVACAQVTAAHTLAPKPIVQEHFVWVQDPKDQEQVKAALAFYDRFQAWARSLGCEIMIIEERTDIPHDLIKTRLGRVFARQTQFARV